MKKISLLLFVALLSISLEAQVQTPAPSPFSKLEQKVGLTDVVLEYSRPSMRGKEGIWGFGSFRCHLENRCQHEHKDHF
ncbi:Protein of unknown function [Flagellimonas taeanensis]|uniref:Uncharacterized protein n=1 Tax=Flagellimonas taeanensis TaxID=1005926 RepID=A0A1I1H6Y8_9FLAO|nr:Protein of unknown function [Allomuricauda taeanensis]